MAQFKIGLLGAGHIGGLLAAHFSKAGHAVEVANSRGPQSLEEKAREWGAKAVTSEEVVRDKDIIVVTIPQGKTGELKPLFKDVPAKTIVIDTNNYYPLRDGKIDGIERGQPESEWVAELIGHPVVKVFNNILFLSLAAKGRPRGEPSRVALPVAGDREEDKQHVIKLLDSIGFDGFDAGSLGESWRQQPGAPVYCTDYGLADAKAALARANRAESPKRRDAGFLRFVELLQTGRHVGEVIAFCRELNDPK
jgi:predicted dinucleotide-binding enzyme